MFVLFKSMPWSDQIEIGFVLLIKMYNNTDKEKGLI